MDYLVERVRRDNKSKIIQQSAYLLVKGLVRTKDGNSGLFAVLDDLFEIPKQQVKPTPSEEELINEFENYVKGV